MIKNNQPTAPSDGIPQPTIKCVVWDLDNTIWDGVLLESADVTLAAGVIDIIEALDRRGILQSIASRNDRASAMAKLDSFGLSEYFLYPQINWNTKSNSIQQIAQLINISLDTIAFIDDQPFEREEVLFALPDVRCIDSVDLQHILDMPAMNPRFITEDSKLRRVMYQHNIARNQAEHTFRGTNEDFLATLGMVFTITRAQESDLQRAEELTLRTHQLNTTGYTYSYDDLNALRQSQDHTLLIADLSDKYGPYGKIGLVLLARQSAVWTIKLLLMSCRVMSRGVGTVMINTLMSRAKKANVRLQAEFVPTERNRMMYIAYKFSGFNKVDEHNGVMLLENNLEHIQPAPTYMTIVAEDESISNEADRNSSPME